MPTLREMIDLMERLAAESGESLTEQFTISLEREITRRWSGSEIYVPQADSRKDRVRGEAIAAAARKLPRGIVCERFGVSRQLVSYYVKKGKNPRQ